MDRPAGSNDPAVLYTEEAFTAGQRLSATVPLFHAARRVGAGLIGIDGGVAYSAQSRAESSEAGSAFREGFSCRPWDHHSPA